MTRASDQIIRLRRLRDLDRLQGNVYLSLRWVRVIGERPRRIELAPLVESSDTVSF